MSLTIYLLDNNGKLIWSKNITHNLNKMAEAAGLYEALWCPYRLSNQYSSFMTYEEEMSLENRLQIKAKDIYDYVKKGHRELTENPEKYTKYNPLNGWGSYETLVEFVFDYMTVLFLYPEAIIKCER